MSEREYAVKVIESLSDEKLEAFLTLFGDENTLARIETESIANNPYAKRYKNFGEFMNEMERDNGV